MDEEKDLLTQAVQVSRLLADVSEKQERENRRLWVAFVVLLLVCIVLAGSFIYSVTHLQAAFNEAMLQAFDTISEMEIVEETTTTTTTTQTVEGDSATINNVDGEQYNDSAQNIRGGE